MRRAVFTALVFNFGIDCSLIALFWPLEMPNDFASSVIIIHTGAAETKITARAFSANVDVIRGHLDNVTKLFLLLCGLIRSLKLTYQKKT